MPRVVHFEISVDDPERAVSFYQNVFGWKIEKWDSPVDYWLVSTGSEQEPGINGGLMRRMHPTVTTINSIDVPSVDEYIDKVRLNGGQIITEKLTIPGVGYMAYCTDTEGNPFGVFQYDQSAH